MKKRLFISDLAFLAFIFCAAALFFPENANAGYLDPGSGSTLVQGIIAFCASISRFFRRIGAVFTGKREK